ncbi:MAG: hypothetical protein ILO42_07670 [Clostridia bacterium]|nr:hypothetical protein [Clostridia bacterium]
MERNRLKKLIIDMAKLMSVTGYTEYDLNSLANRACDYFDECRMLPGGSVLFIRRCGRPDAKRIMIDTHYDEIGMMVSEILDGGFLRIEEVGGLDARVLQSSEVCVWGTEPDGSGRMIVGVVTSTPPHLQKPGDADRLKKASELLVDTGYSKETLEKFVRIGTPVGFMPRYTELKNGCIAGKGFDDKACCACAIAAVSSVPRAELTADVYLNLATFEEDGTFMGGALTAAEYVRPDCALVADVNLGRTPDTKKSETVEVGGGASLTLAPFTDRKLTSALAAEADAEGVKYQYSVESRSAGTDTDVIATSCGGVPVVDVGLPLKNMHTAAEVLSLDDAESLTGLIKLFITSERVRDAI